MRGCSHAPWTRVRGKRKLPSARAGGDRAGGGFVENQTVARGPERPTWEVRSAARTSRPANGRESAPATRRSGREEVASVIRGDEERTGRVAGPHTRRYAPCQFPPRRVSPRAKPRRLPPGDDARRQRQEIQPRSEAPLPVPALRQEPKTLAGRRQDLSLRKRATERVCSLAMAAPSLPVEPWKTAVAVRATHWSASASTCSTRSSPRLWRRRKEPGSPANRPRSLSPATEGRPLAPCRESPGAWRPADRAQRTVHRLPRRTVRTPDRRGAPRPTDGRGKLWWRRSAGESCRWYSGKAGPAVFGSPNTRASVPSRIVSGRRGSWAIASTASSPGDVREKVAPPSAER